MLKYLKLLNIPMTMLVFKYVKLHYTVFLIIVFLYDIVMYVNFNVFFKSQ